MWCTVRDTWTKTSLFTCHVDYFIIVTYTCKPLGLQTGTSNEVELYQLHKVGLTLLHNTGSRSKVLQKGSTFSILGLDQRSREGVVITTSPRLSTAVLEVFPKDKRVDSVLLPIAERHALTVVSTYAPNSNSKYLAFFKSLDGVYHKSWEFSHPVYICYVDLEKAYSCVDLGSYGVNAEYVPGLLLWAIQSLHNQSESYVYIFITKPTYFFSMRIKWRLRVYTVFSQSNATIKVINTFI